MLCEAYWLLKDRILSFGGFMKNKNIRNGISIIILLLLSSIVVGCIGPDDDGNGNGDNDKKLITVILGPGEEVDFDSFEMEKMKTIEGSVSFQKKSGNYGEVAKYKVIPMKEILAEAVKVLSKAGSEPIMKPGDNLKVSASDGYSHEFNYYNIYPPESWYQFQGDFGLGISLNDESIPNWQDGPMTVLLPEDGKYSSEDSNATSAPGQGYFNTISAGARFVRNVAKIEVISNSVDEWTVNLTGSISEMLSKTDFEMLEHYYKVEFTDNDSHVWSGVPLWRIIGRVDDQDAFRGESAFNETISNTGYNISVIATDDYSKSFSSSFTAKNNKILLANRMDGELLDDDNKPLKLVGSDLENKQMVRNIKEIKIHL
jgi:hypothetical protein